jgi:hypothetical protein
MNTKLISEVDAAFRAAVAEEIESMKPRASEQLKKAQNLILTLSGDLTTANAKLECSERYGREQHIKAGFADEAKAELVLACDTNRELRRQLKVEEIRRGATIRSLRRQIRILKWSNDAHEKWAKLSNSHDYGTPVVTESPTQYNKLWDEYIDMRDQRDRLAAASKAPW